MKQEESAKKIYKEQKEVLEIINMLAVGEKLSRMLEDKIEKPPCKQGK